MDNQRTFSKEQISKIIAKASKIQARKDLYGEEQGLTEDELIHIAEEVGIDSESLFEAIHSSDLPEMNSSFNWITATSKIQDVHIVNGEITEESWEEIVHEIRRVTGGIGKLNKVGKSFEWEQRLKEVGYKHISLTPEKGATKIQFVSNWRGLKITSSILSFIAGIAITGIALDGTSYPDVVYFLLPLLGGFGTLGVGRFYLRHYFEKQKSMFRNMVRSIEKGLSPQTEPPIEIEDNEMQKGKLSANQTKINHQRS